MIFVILVLATVISAIQGTAVSVVSLIGNEEHEEECVLANSKKVMVSHPGQLDHARHAIMHDALRQAQGTRKAQLLATDKRTKTPVNSPGHAAPRRVGGTAACRRRRRPDVAGARGSGAVSACTHMSHVTTKSCSWSRCSSPSVAYALALVRSTQKLRGHAPPAGAPRSEEPAAWGRHFLEGVLFARVGVRDNVGPQCITERSTHLLGNAREQPAPALLCSLARHLGQFDRLVRTQAR